MIFKKKEIAFIFICIILTQNVFALVGVTPSRYEMNFEPSMKRVVHFRFVSDENMPFKVYSKGSLSGYVGLSTTRLESKGGVVNVLLDFPEGIEIPGSHRILIGAEQIPIDRHSGVGVAANIQASIWINVPYPGKYVEAELKTEDARYGDITEWTLKLMSKGKEEVMTYSYIEIYDSKGDIVKTIPIGENFLKSQETKELYVDFDSVGHRAGKYKAVAVIEYENREAKSESQFRIGELFVDLISYTKKFIRGKINPMNLEIENYWNDPIENVFAEVFILNQNIRFKTPSITLKGFERTNLTGYFDTTTIPVETKEVQARITIKYGDKITEKFVLLKIKKEIDYVTYALIGIVIILAILLIGVMFLSRRIYSIKRERERGLKNEKKRKR